MNEFNFNSYGNSKQSISYCEVDKCPAIIKLKEQLKRKEQECEELNKELHKNFEEKDTLHLIIDRLLEASGYDTNTASAEDFEDVYEHMRYEQQQLDQLKAENRELKAVHSTNVALSDELFKYKAENEELREKYLELKEKEGNLVVQLNTITEAREQSKQNNKALEKENLDLISTEVKLRQTLAEIRDIATCCIEGDVARIRMKQILQKISEVNNED